MSHSRIGFLEHDKHSTGPVKQRFKIQGKNLQDLEIKIILNNQIKIR
jgi:hypothetical protein